MPAGSARYRTPPTSAAGSDHPTRRNAITAANSHSAPNVSTSQLFAMNSAANSADANASVAGRASHRRHVSGVAPCSAVSASASATSPSGSASTCACRSPSSSENAGNSLICAPVACGSTRVARHHHQNCVGMPCDVATDPGSPSTPRRVHSDVAPTPLAAAMSAAPSSGASHSRPTVAAPPATHGAARRRTADSATTSPASPNATTPASAPAIARPRLNATPGPLPESWPTTSTAVCPRW